MVRDLLQTQEILAAWLAGRLDQPELTVGPLSAPSAGYSNETFLGEACWPDPDGAGVTRTRLVLRIEPTDHQVFVQPDALFQAAVMSALRGRPGVHVPRIWGVESDPALLGAPFFVMDFVPGRIPGDVPGWHRAGWTVDLTPADQNLLYDNGLRALVALHAVPVTPEFAFLQPDLPPGGDALGHFLARATELYDWCGDGRRFAAGTWDAALDHVLSSRPAATTTGIVWGDARVGNICFGDDLAVTGMFDWETATLGPPEIDLGWWLMFEDFLSDAQGVPRLPGVPGPAETVSRYEEISGRRVVDIGYYQLLASLMLGLVNGRLADLLVSLRGIAPEVARRYPLRCAAMATRQLRELGVAHVPDPVR